MNWASLAVLSAATFSIVLTIDSYILSRRMPGLRAFLLILSIFYLIYGLLSFYLFPLEETGVWPVLVAIVSGTLRTAAIAIMLYNLKKEEVSRVIPVVYTYPIFVAIIAVPLLGETLHYLQWLAIIVVVAGAVMVSLKQSPSGSTRWPGKPLLILFGSGLLFAVADITSKYALAYISAWNMFSLTAFCLAGIFLLFSLRPSIIRQIRNLPQRNSTIALLAFTETLSPIAAILVFLALETGPVSLVSTITSSRPIFVVIFAFILSRVSPQLIRWQPGKGMLALRLIATAMIVGGIAIIYLT